MMRQLPIVVISLSLLACGGSEDVSHTGEPSVADPPADEAEAPEVAEQTSEEPASEAVDPRARAIHEAEAFVRAQGYTDVPPTVPDEEIVHEGIEGSIAMRLNMLEPRAASARGEGDDWMVIFRYRDARYAGRGRAVRLHSGDTPLLVHQDVVVSAWE